MDIDLELDYADRITEFLRSKLKEIKSENVRLESSLQYRREIVSQLRSEITENNSSLGLKIMDIWKKTVNGKYVIGIEVENQNETPVDNFTVTLDWTSSTPLTYKFYILPTRSNLLVDGLKFTPHLCKSAQVIIILDVPLFSEQLCYTISGSLSFQKNTSRITIKFPKNLELVPEDFTDNCFIVHLYNVVEGNIKDLLALAFSGEKYEFVMVIGRHFEQLLESVLTRIDIDSKKKYYVGYKISPMIDGALLEVEGNDEGQNFETNIYCKDFVTAIALLHFLHKNIAGVSFISKSVHQIQFPPNQLTEMIKNSIVNELTQLETRSRDGMTELKSKVTDLERQTDALVSQLNEKQFG